MILPITLRGSRSLPFWFVFIFPALCYSRKRKKRASHSTRTEKVSIHSERVPFGSTSTRCMWRRSSHRSIGSWWTKAIDPSIRSINKPLFRPKTSQNPEVLASEIKSISLIAIERTICPVKESDQRPGWSKNSIRGSGKGNLLYKWSWGSLEEEANREKRFGSILYHLRSHKKHRLMFFVHQDVANSTREGRVKRTTTLDVERVKDPIPF